MLTLEEIKKIVFGTVDIKEQDSWYVFYRLSERQREAAKRNNHKTIQYATTGVRMDIVGSVQKISFDYRISPGSFRTFYGIDVLENGEARYHILEKIDETVSSFSYVPSGDGRITVYFPYDAIMEIKNVIIEGTYEPYSHSSRWYIIGDSITQGFDTIFPMNSYVNRLMRSLDADFVNQAIGGDVFFAENLDPDLNYPADYALVGYGTNDWSHGNEPTKHANEFFTELRKMYPTIPLFYITPIWREKVKTTCWDMTLPEYRKIVTDIAKSYQITVIDGSDLVPEDKSLFSFGSALHPNDDGFCFYAQNLQKKLIEYLRRNDKK